MKTTKRKTPNRGFWVAGELRWRPCLSWWEREMILDGLKVSIPQLEQEIQHNVRSPHYDTEEGKARVVAHFEKQLAAALSVWNKLAHEKGKPGKALNDL